MDTRSIEELHRRLAKGNDLFFDLVWTHSNIVWEIAEGLCNSLPNSLREQVDMELLKDGALLHDIGVYAVQFEDFQEDESLPRYIEHGFKGAETIKKERLGERLARFASNHTGVGLTRESIEEIGIDVDKQDYLPVSMEEELVCYSDKFHSKYPRFVTYEDAYKSIGKFGVEKQVRLDTFKRKYGLPDIGGIKSKYGQWEGEMVKRIYG